VSDALSQCEKFLSAIFDPADVIEFRSLKPVTKRFAAIAKLAVLVAELQKLNAEGAQIYFGANPRKHSGGSTADGVALARCLYADFDGGVTVEEAWSRIKAAGLPMPTVTIATGGGVHCWWRLDQPITDAKLHGRLLKGLAAALASDEAGTSGWPRIMRLPGFVNHKYEHKPVAELVDVDASRAYSLGELTPATPGMSETTRAFVERGSLSAAGGRREAMFAAACDLRDRGWTPEAAEAVLMPRMRQFDLSAEELADCPRQIHNAWTRPPRPVTGATSASSPAASSSIPAWRPFPTSALPAATASLVEESARAIGCDEAFVALPLLAVLGSAIGTTRRVELKPGWTALPILWPVTVAESGSHKSPAADVSLEHVREREDRLHEEYLEELSAYEYEVETYEKARAAWRHSKQAGDEAPARPREPLQRRVLVEDATVEALVAALADNSRGLLVATDELAGQLDSFGRYNGSAGSDEAFFLKAYSGRSHNVSRRTGRRTIHVRQAAIWLTGTIQPGVLARSLGVERRESGFLARLLLAAPPRRPKRWTTDSVSWTTRDSFVRVLDNLYGLKHELVDGRERSRIVRLSRAAETLFVEFFHEHDSEAIQHSGDLAAAWSKLEETAGRLALIVHETRIAAGEKLDADELDEASMAAAIELTGWFKYETKRVYRLLAESAEDRVVRQADERLAAYVAAQGGRVAVRDVIAGVRWIKDAETAETALQRLVDAGRGDWIAKSATDAGGRPTRLFVLKPEAVSAQPPKKAEIRGSADADARQRAEVEVADEEEIEVADEEEIEV
jgi:hypothetical protein